MTSSRHLVCLFEHVLAFYVENRLTLPTVYIKELDGKNIVQITSGPQHSLALDSTGFVVVNTVFHFHDDFLFRVVYVWGYNGYCRLGLGNQVDALKPKVVPQVRASFVGFLLI